MLATTDPVVALPNPQVVTLTPSRGDDDFTSVNGAAQPATNATQHHQLALGLAVNLNIDPRSYPALVGSEKSRWGIWFRSRSTARGGRGC
jgi:hypothetical protein